MNEVMTEKMQKLAELCEGRQEILLADLAKDLGVPDNEELEELITKAVLSREINGKIDERERKLCVYAHRQRIFGEDQWKELSTSVSVMLERLVKAEDYMKKCIEQRDMPWNVNVSEESSDGEEDESAEKATEKAAAMAA